MSNPLQLGDLAIAISVSDSPDMPTLGLSEEHLRDAMAEITRYLLALGARMVYGGDLREGGFSELLFELTARYGGNTGSDIRPRAVNYLAWPVHIRQKMDALERFASELEGACDLVCLTPEGEPLDWERRKTLSPYEPSDEEWAAGLTAMRHTLREATEARVVLGGRVDRYRGAMPGIAEEALLSLQIRQPLFILGGFGGCARDISETFKLCSSPEFPRQWKGRGEFAAFSVRDYRNGLTKKENMILARTPHVDQAVMLIMRGLLKTLPTLRPSARG